jgi:hypothetical protein
MSKVLDGMALVGMSLGYAWFLALSSDISVFWKYTSYQAYDIVWLYYFLAGHPVSWEVIEGWDIRVSLRATGADLPCILAVRVRLVGANRYSRQLALLGHLHTCHTLGIPPPHYLH